MHKTYVVGQVFSETALNDNVVLFQHKIHIVQKSTVRQEN